MELSFTKSFFLHVPKHLIDLGPIREEVVNIQTI